MKRVVVSGGFDNMQFADFRFLEEAAKFGSVQVLLWSDQALGGAKFPLAERHYMLQAVRYVDRITVLQRVENPDALPTDADVWVVRQADDSPGKRDWVRSRGVDYQVIPETLLQAAPPPAPTPVNPPSSNKKVVVTGCFDWFHSGHVRFFEEVSELGDLYVVVGHDANIRLLKGQGHPMFPDVQRCYIVGSIRYVRQALISSGSGWMDAEPEFLKIRPDIYAVNEDGDRPEKRDFCQRHGIEYRVLKRLPKEGLPRRQSTALRGF